MIKISMLEIFTNIHSNCDIKTFGRTEKNRKFNGIIRDNYICKFLPYEDWNTNAIFEY